MNIKSQAISFGIFCFGQLLKHRAFRYIFSFFRKKEKDAAAITIAARLFFTKVEMNLEMHQSFVKPQQFFLLNRDIL